MPRPVPARREPWVGRHLSRHLSCRPASLKASLVPQAWTSSSRRKLSRLGSATTTVRTLPDNDTTMLSPRVTQKERGGPPRDRLEAGAAGVSRTCRGICQQDDINCAASHHDTKRKQTCASLMFRYGMRMHVFGLSANRLSLSQIVYSGLKKITAFSKEELVATANRYATEAREAQLLCHAKVVACVAGYAKVVCPYRVRLSLCVAPAGTRPRRGAWPAAAYCGQNGARPAPTIVALVRVYSSAAQRTTRCPLRVLVSASYCMLSPWRSGVGVCGGGGRPH